MASGKQKHLEYQAALNALGRELSRRARSACELSGERGKLFPFDLEGPDVEPAVEHVVLVTDGVAEALAAAQAGKALPATSDAYRYLENVVWSTERPIRRAAVSLLSRIDEPWARDAIDNAEQMDAADAAADD